ncbi:hypothetical protein BKA70DRAFT_679970 [Coprinopsis sp. MPI-PUGE-AT-0042]|nr:hypothetical protein BKA70DRAFT_679970 [Coprinopsis sp. MPI-PUGE-AT-0042]
MLPAVEPRQDGGGSEDAMRNKRLRWAADVEICVFYRFSEEFYFDGSQSPAPPETIELPEDDCLSLASKRRGPYSQVTELHWEPVRPSLTENGIDERDESHRLIKLPAFAWDSHHARPNYHRTYPKPSIKLQHIPGSDVRVLELDEPTPETGDSTPPASLPSHLLSPLPSVGPFDTLESEFDATIRGDNARESGASPGLDSPSNMSPSSLFQLLVSTPDPWTSGSYPRRRGESPSLNQVLLELMTSEQEARSVKEVSQASGEMRLGGISPLRSLSSPSSSRLLPPTSARFSTSDYEHQSYGLYLNPRNRLDRDTPEQGGRGERSPALYMGPSPPAISPLRTFSTTMTPIMASWGPSPSTMQLSLPMMISPPMFRYGMEYRGMQEQLVG